MICFVGVATSTFAGEELPLGSNTDNFTKLSFKELFNFVSRILIAIVISWYLSLSEYHVQGLIGGTVEIMSKRWEI
jgi:hypothetical protein